MLDENDHSACVDAWLARAGTGLSAEQLLDVFELGFATLWRRALLTLGEVTLTAIADRVLYGAKERFPILSALELRATGLRCRELQERAGSLPRDQLAQGIRFVMVEFLTVLGNLTADILTPGLHAELSKAASEERRPGGPGGGSGEQASYREPPNPESNDEESEP